MPCDINPQSPGQTMAFGEVFFYNSAGRITQKKLGFRRGANGVFGVQYLIASWTYNNEGQVLTTAYPSHQEGAFEAAREVKNTYDGIGRLNVVETKLGAVNQQVPGWQSVVSNVQFNAFGAVTSLNHLGVAESRTYNELGQMTRLTKGTLIDVEYRFSATANDGQILSQKNWLTGEDVIYHYDELERLIAASTTAGPQSWGLSWSYDGFGNRLAQSVTQESGPVNSVLVNANTNRISSAGSSYDANGNMTLMPKGAGSMTMDYDLSNRLQQVTNSAGTEQYRYAPDNRRVWRSAGKGACSAYKDNDQNLTWFGTGDGVGELLTFYSPGGEKMGVYCFKFSPNFLQAGVTASEENVYFGGRLVGKRVLSQSGIDTGLVGAFTSDRLQSRGNGSRYYPYGKSKTGAAGDDREQFATYTRDEKSGLDYADQRWYAREMGRFTSADPFNGSSEAMEPKSWNKFSYASADPVERIDPEGLT